MNRRLLLALDLALVALTAWQGWRVGMAMAARVGAPFDLEWMEGGTLITGLRASQGLPFYTEPGLDYVPFIYPPLYAWILGALAHVAPLGYALGRSVSIVCAVLASGALAFAAWREGARPALALACAGLFWSCYAEGGTFYDLVRTDALAIALLGWALALSRGESKAETIAGGLVLAVAFAAKHHAAAFGIPIALGLWLRDGWRRAALFAVASAVPALLFTIAMQVASGGLFLTYLLEVPAHHGMAMDRLLPNVKNGRVYGAQAELFRALPLATVAGLLFAKWWPNRAYWLGVSLTGLLVASLMRGHQGGFLNVLIPTMWIQSIFPALVHGALDRVPRLANWRAWAPHLAAVLAGVQLWQGQDDLSRYVPRPGDAANAARLVEELRALPEPMLVPHAPWLPVLAGKQPSLALIALWDIDHNGGPFKADVRKVKKAIAAKRWKTVVTPDADLGYGLADHYVVAKRIASGPPTRTGWNVRLRRVWAPKP